MLEDVSLDVAPGEALCPSALGRRIHDTEPARGAREADPRARAFFDGAPVSARPRARGRLPRRRALSRGFHPEKNVAFPLEVAGVAPAERAERVDELLRLVHLSRFRGAFPHELSGGCQRGAIARAPATRPRMIL
ncbi:MAG: hypothetical protein KIS78_18595 [Labilithrix sp.]|nr:hypothetical protein [Labilithrix sp.]